MAMGIWMFILVNINRLMVLDKCPHPIMTRMMEPRHFYSLMTGKGTLQMALWPQGWIKKTVGVLLVARWLIWMLIVIWT